MSAMNPYRIQECANRIAEYERALVWLREFGVKLGTRGDSAAVDVRPNLASACTGATEAAKVLSAYARLALPDIVETAIRSCVNTIEMDKQAIRAELDRPSLPTPTGAP